MQSILGMIQSTNAFLDSINGFLWGNFWMRIVMAIGFVSLLAGLIRR